MLCTGIHNTYNNDSAKNEADNLIEICYRDIRFNKAEKIATKAVTLILNNFGLEIDIAKTHL